MQGLCEASRVSTGDKTTPSLLWSHPCRQILPEVARPLAMQGLLVAIAPSPSGMRDVQGTSSLRVVSTTSFSPPTLTEKVKRHLSEAAVGKQHGLCQPKSLEDSTPDTVGSLLANQAYSEASEKRIKRTAIPTSGGAAGEKPPRRWPAVQGAGLISAARLSQLPAGPSWA